MTTELTPNLEVNMMQILRESRKLVIALTSGVTIFVFLPFYTNYIANQGVMAVSHTQQVEKEIADIRDATYLFVYRLRTYLTTGSESYLNAAALTLPHILNEIEQARSLVQHNPTERDRLDALHHNVEAVGRDLQAKVKSIHLPVTVEEIRTISSQLNAFLESTSAVVESSGEEEHRQLIASQLRASEYMKIANIAAAVVALMMTLSGGYLILFLRKDIRRRIELEAELIAAKKNADSANLAKSAFLANMSHEIRTPLGAVLGFADLLARGEVTPENQKTYIDTIQRNGRALMQVIDDILDLSKVEAGKLTVDPRPMDLSDTVADVSSLFSHRAHEKGLDFRVEWIGHVPRIISSDETRLRQILINIVGNAVKFTSKGNVSLQIKWHSIPGEKLGRLEFYVRDTGLGISEEQREKLFQSFSQSDHSISRKFGGTGLGLVLSRRLAQALGGDLILDNSTPGHGSTFKAYIATEANVRSPSTVKRSRTIETTDNKTNLTGLNILIAEDAPDNQLLIATMLRQAGASTECANDGQEALEKCSHKNYDMVLMDIQMPRLDGYAATATLRGQGYRGPILALSAHAMKDERDKSMRAGCDDHITKPVHPEALLATISSHLGQLH